MSAKVLHMDNAREATVSSRETAQSAETYANLLELMRLFESGDLTGLALVGTLKNGNLVSSITGDAVGDDDVSEQLQILSSQQL